MSTIGVALPSRRVLASKWIPKLANKAFVANAASLKGLELFDCATDRWRKKYCLHASPMQNFIVNTHHGARFYDVTNMSDICGHGAAENISVLIFFHALYRAKLLGTSIVGAERARFLLVT
jgi:hypothetical protein